MQKEKLMPQMSFWTVIFVALFSVSYMSGITNTFCSRTEHATWLFDTDLRRFELAIRTTNLEWYSEGIKLLAFGHNQRRWEKRDISWGIVRDSETLDRQTVVDAAIMAFGKWSAETRLNFRGPVEQPDIQIVFERFNPNRTPAGNLRVTTIRFLTNQAVLDDHGTRIALNDNANWTQRGLDWCNIEFALLRGMGHSLGLDRSQFESAIMSDHHQWMNQESRPLDQDDIDGIRSACGYTERTAWLFGTDQRGFEQAIRTGNPKWYLEGIQLSAYHLSEQRWEKRNISWGILRDSETLDRQTVENAAILAFDKWSAETQLRFTGPVEQPDIQIEFRRFEPIEGQIPSSEVLFLTNGAILDDFGTRITINDNANWTERRRRDWYNIEFTFLHEIGHSLGLNHSNYYLAMMCHHHLWLRFESRPLHWDDIARIQALYGPPKWQTLVRLSAPSNSNRERI